MRLATLEPPTSINAIIHPARTSPDTITAAQIAGAASEQWAAEVAALGVEPARLPQAHHIGYKWSISRERNVQLTPLVGKDNEAYLLTIGNIAPEFRKSYKETAQAIEELITTHRGGCAGLKQPDSGSYPSVSLSEPMSICTIPGISPEDVPQAKSVPMSSEDHKYMEEKTNEMIEAGVVREAHGAPALAHAFVVRADGKDPRIVVGM